MSLVTLPGYELRFFLVNAYVFGPRRPTVVGHNVLTKPKSD